MGHSQRWVCHVARLQSCILCPVKACRSRAHRTIFTGKRRLRRVAVAPSPAPYFSKLRHTNIQAAMREVQDHSNLMKHLRLSHGEKGRGKQKKDIFLELYGNLSLYQSKLSLS